jgi:tetratricopeptide (TPR) repeat protein
MDDPAAVADADKAVELAPESTAALNLRGSIRLAAHDYAGALADFAAVLAADENDATALNAAAWIKATCPDERFRNPEEAHELARRLNDNTGHQEAGYLDTLAAACAALGRWEHAVKWGTKAAGLVPPDERGPYKQRVELYKSEQAFVDHG